MTLHGDDLTIFDVCHKSNDPSVTGRLAHKFLKDRFLL